MNESAPPSPPTTASPIECAVLGLCPRCGAPGLFDGAVRFARSCNACGLDFTSFNVGDGAAAFLILIVGAIVSVLAIVVDLRWAPPWWAHLILWVPLTIAMTILATRIAKALLLVLEYRNDACEGRIAKEDR